MATTARNTSKSPALIAGLGISDLPETQFDLNEPFVCGFVKSVCRGSWPFVAEARIAQINGATLFYQIDRRTADCQSPLHETGTDLARDD
jgi:hypothetical protein